MPGLIRGACLLIVAVLAGCQADMDDALEPSPSSTASTASTQQRQAPMTGTSRVAPTATTSGTAVRPGMQLRNAMVGRRNPDGTVTTACFDDADSVATFLHDPSVAAETRVAQ